MKLKKSYTVKGAKYKVILCDMPDLCGNCDPNKKEIKINSNMSAKDKELTLYHELGHAVLFEVGIHQTSVHYDLHEIIVENFSTLIFDLVKAR